MELGYKPVVYTDMPTDAETGKHYESSWTETEAEIIQTWNLVDDPDAVTVTEVQGDQELTLELRVAPEDMGKVIGRQGRVVKEIRVLMKAVAQRQGKKVSVEILD